MLAEPAVRWRDSPPQMKWKDSSSDDEDDDDDDDDGHKNVKFRIER